MCNEYVHSIDLYRYIYISKLYLTGLLLFCFLLISSEDTNPYRHACSRHDLQKCIVLAVYKRGMIRSDKSLVVHNNTTINGLMPLGKSDLVNAC